MTEPTEQHSDSAPDGANLADAERPISDDSNAADDVDAAGRKSDALSRFARRVDWSRVLTYGALPGLALLFAIADGLFRWQVSSARAAELARTESVAAAKESTIALLSYRPDTVEKVAEAAEGRLTGKFKDNYTRLTRDLVIPGAKEKHVSVDVGVPASAPISATPTHAVALLYVNQSAVVGGEPPINTASSIKVTLEKIGGRWLISAFDPI